MKNSKTLAFLGTGLMGEPMAHRLLQAGIPLAVWNRTKSKTGDLAAAGARVCCNPREALDGAEIAVTMLSSATAVEETIFASGAWQRMRRGALLIDMSSIPPAIARAQSARLAQRGVQCLDAPVSGGTRGAKAGTLSIFVGGLKTAFERALPTLEVLGHPFYLGESGAGQTAKLANQVIVSGTLAAVAEGLSFACRAGLDAELLRAALAGGFAGSRILDEHGQRMVSGDFTPGAPNHIFLKDLRTALEQAADIGAELPITSHIRSIYEELVDDDLGQLDHSSIILRYR